MSDWDPQAQSLIHTEEVKNITHFLYSLLYLQCIVLLVLCEDIFASTMALYGVNLKIFSKMHHTLSQKHYNCFSEIFLKVSVKGKTSGENEQEESYSASPTSSTWLDRKLDAVSFIISIYSSAL